MKRPVTPPKSSPSRGPERGPAKNKSDPTGQLLAEVGLRRTEAAKMGGAKAVARQHAAGRLSVRERIDALLDGSSFQEIGALAGHADYRADGSLQTFVPANFVCGVGLIDGRRVAVGGDDFTVRAGASDGSIVAKLVHFERMACEMRIPAVRLIEGSGGGGSVRSLETLGRTYIPEIPGCEFLVKSLSLVPQVAAALGPVAGLGAARLTMTHFSVMVKGISQVFVAGPPLVAAGVGERVTKEELGGWEVACHAGTVDNAVDSEAEALSQIRRFLSYLPANVWQIPPRLSERFDPPERRSDSLRDLVPPNRRLGYPIRRGLEAIFDVGSIFEMARAYGASLMTAFGRLDGYPIAIMASDPNAYAGAMTADAAQKMSRFVGLAQTFHLPVVHFVDQPGMQVGTAAEKSGTLRQGARALVSVYDSDVPWAAIIMRRVFGVGGAAHRNHSRHGLRVAWPTGYWGSLPLEGGVEAAYRDDINGADDPAAKREEIRSRLEAIASPLRSAEAFLIEDVIDPAETRPLLCDWIGGAYELLATDYARPEPRRYRP